MKKQIDITNKLRDAAFIKDIDGVYYAEFDKEYIDDLALLIGKHEMIIPDAKKYYLNEVEVSILIEEIDIFRNNIKKEE